MREILEAFSSMMPMLIGLLGGFFIISGGDERVSGTIFWVFFGIAVSFLAASIVELVKTLRDVLEKKKNDTTVLMLHEEINKARQEVESLKAENRQLREENRELTQEIQELRPPRQSRGRTR